jgi:oligopeptidase B
MSNGPDTHQPPEARREPTTREIHGVITTDDYAWMGHDDTGLLAYLKAERAHYDAVTSHSGPLRDLLFEEMSERLLSTDASVSWRHGDWLYYTRTVHGKQYREFCRDAVADSAETQVLLDLNAMAAGSAYFALGVREVSPNGALLAYSVDTDGDEAYELRIRDLSSGADLADVIPRSYYGCAWSADSATVLYTVHDAAFRPHQVWRHRIGTPVEADTMVYEEADERFHLMLDATRSGEVAVIASKSTDTSEVRLLRTADVDGEPLVVAPRRAGIEYSVDHVAGEAGGEIYIVTNDGATEFRLMRAPVHSQSHEQWVEVIGGNPAERLLAVDAFNGHLVLTLRREGSLAVRVMDLATGTLRDEPAHIPAGMIQLSGRDDEHEPVRDRFDSNAFTVVIESLIEPPSWWEIDLATGARTLRKTEPVPGYSSSDYVTRRIDVIADDGTAVPVTLAYRADVKQDGTAPGWLYGYGSYEACIDPWFQPKLASALDRGVVYGVAHIRGGGERGRDWWEQGRLQRKRTTFTDFIAAADTLAKEGWVDGDRIATRGASAGGLLQGAALSMAPQRWRALVAQVPFVDVVTTMLDPSLPLTIGEWQEWGDPRTPEDFTYMLSYSPYDNVPLGPRPDLLVTGSLNDTRVMIREPAKWVAKLRATQSDDSVVLFRAEVGSASHGGASGRYDRLRIEAEIFAFVLEALGATERGGG